MERPTSSPYTTFRNVMGKTLSEMQAESTIQKIEPQSLPTASEKSAGRIQSARNAPVLTTDSAYKNNDDMAGEMENPFYQGVKEASSHHVITPKRRAWMCM
jgi:hypothetical protein